MKILKFLTDNILFVITLFLLFFIPLYPKLPLLDVQNTWVYIRLEDFLVAAAGIAWLIQFIRKKAILKTPLTIPIFIFWLVGGLATLFAVIVFFPHLANVHPSIALLHYLRRIEYVMLFFIAVSSMRKKEFVPYVITTLSITLFLVCLYGFGQKFLGFPAFLTMNEEFAKGTPLTLSQAGRVAATFAGHYDLAAYLVLMASIMGSLTLGVKKLYAKITFAFLVFLSLSLLLLTTSRVSFVVYFLSMIFLLIIRKTKIKKEYFLTIPLILLVVFFTNYFQGITDRFSDTLSQAQIVVDTKSGEQLGIVSSLTDENGVKKITIEEKQATGEELPQGSKYISLPTAKVTRVKGEVTIKKFRTVNGEQKEIVTTKAGEFVIKNVVAYDVSFTTRIQGTWPRAIKAFNRNMLTGSGYSSIDVGTDGNYLRILGEVGILGLLSFVFIFVVFGIYVYRVLPNVTESLPRSLILGIVAGVFGIGLNAILIDVFEASKIAYTMWLLIGVAVGTLMLYQKGKVDILKDVRGVLTSIPAIILYFFLATFVLFWNSINNYFVGDDFTWLRWAADCAKEISANKIMECESLGKTVIRYFTDATDFFYRPGTKLYFFAMYTLFGLGPIAYHAFSIFVHFLNVSLVFFLSLSLLNSKKYALIVALLFLASSTHSETVFWISSINHLLAATFILLSLLSFITWKKSKNIILLLISYLSVFISPLFHELGIVAPLLIITYDLLFDAKKQGLRIFRRWYLYLFLLQIPLYFFIRINAQSYWMKGDYSYNLLALPFNIAGNSIGYIAMILFGGNVLTIHQTLRGSLRSQELLIGVGVIFVLVALFFLLKKASPFLKRNGKVYLFGLALFIIPLLPFLGLGNITLRYSYLATFGLLFLIVTLIKDLLKEVSLVKRKSAAVILLCLAFLFLLFHIYELQNENKDWKKAGEITKLVQLEMSGETVSLSKDAMLYFVNTPVKRGNAWVFPVGLEDALWFTGQDREYLVQTAGSLAEAQTLTSQTPNAYIYIFNEKDRLQRVKKNK